jgi:predicted ArsR family transcriptional regulator
VDDLASIRQAVAKRDQWATTLDERVMAAYEARRSIEQIADALGVEYEAARQRLMRLGVQLRGRGRPSKTDVRS